MVRVSRLVSILFASFVAPTEIGNDLFFRVIGGVKANRNEFPYMIMLMQLNGSLICGGALISEHYVLTAAHCVYNKLATNIIVRLGEYDKNTSNDGPHDNISVMKIIPHPDFDLQLKVHDIALLKLARKARMSYFITPICLPISRRELDGEKAKIAGWGSTDAHGNPVYVLRKLDMTILSHDDCCDRLNYRCVKYLSNEKLCAYSPIGGSCNRDSGGPLVWEDPVTKKPQLVGIISLDLCRLNDLPSIFTRISSYLDWIQENANVDNSIC